jgi:aminoglycoside phosphotransferase (APT) family kinase protein
MQPRSMQIDTKLVRRLIHAQFPHWSGLPLAPVESQGWDNRTFRLGGDMAVRLPSAEVYAPQVAKEHRWLPYLAPALPVAIPKPLAMGRPGETYPWHWSVYSWLEGTSARWPDIVDRPGFARDLAGFLRALQGVDPAGGPTPGAHNFHRGGSLEHYDGETRRAVAILADRLNGTAVIGAWEEALAAEWRGAPLWLHGDFASGNLLVRDGRLAAVIDFGGCAVGDPACDLAIAWTFLGPDERSTFRAALEPSDPDWLRGRGWALWKALVVLAELSSNDPAQMDGARTTLEAILGECSARP